MDPISIGASLIGGLLGIKGSKSKTASTTSTNEPWKEVQPYLKGLYGSAANLAQQQFGQIPGAPQLASSMPYAQYFPYATTTAYNPDPRTMEGLQMGLNYAGNYLPGMIDAQYQSYYDMLNAPDVASNPYVNQMIGQQVGAAGEAFGQNTGRMTDALMRQIIPGIDAGASLAGQYGGTRQGVAQGVAIGDTMQALGDYGTNAARALSGNIANTQMGAYNTGMQSALQAMQMAPNIASLGMMPSQIYQNTGNQLDAFRQQQIDAERQRWDYEQNAPINQMRDAEQRAIQNYQLAMQGMQNQWMPLNMANSIYSGIPWNQTRTQTQPGNQVAGALGGAMTGWDLGRAIGQQFPTSAGGYSSGLPIGSSGNPLQMDGYSYNLF